MMRIVALSDLHGTLPQAEIRECDVVVIAGDIMPLNIQRDMKASNYWFVHTFIPWANELPCEKVVLVAGNHDFYFDEERWISLHPNVPTVEKCLHDESKIIYLKDRGCTIQGVKFWGSPWIEGLPGWAFNTKTPLEYFGLIPKDTDVLVTHAPAYGDVGTVLQKCWNYNSNFGSITLRNILESEDCKIKLSFAGHIHSGLHSGEKIGNTMCYNVSIKDENYKYVFEPFYIELE